MKDNTLLNYLGRRDGVRLTLEKLPTSAAEGDMVLRVVGDSGTAVEVAVTNGIGAYLRKPAKLVDLAQQLNDEEVVIRLNSSAHFKS